MPGCGDLTALLAPPCARLWHQPRVFGVFFPHLSALPSRQAAAAGPGAVKAARCNGDLLRCFAAGSPCPDRHGPVPVTPPLKLYSASRARAAAPSSGELGSPARSPQPRAPGPAEELRSPRSPAGAGQPRGSQKVPWGKEQGAPRCRGLRAGGYGAAPAGTRPPQAQGAPEPLQPGLQVEAVGLVPQQLLVPRLPAAGSGWEAAGSCRAHTARRCWHGTDFAPGAFPSRRLRLRIRSRWRRTPNS